MSQIGQCYIFKSFKSLPSFYSWRCSQSFLLWQLWVVIRLEATCSCSGWIQGNQNNTWRNHNFHLVRSFWSLLCLCVCLAAYCLTVSVLVCNWWDVPANTSLGSSLPPPVIAINLPTPSWPSFPFVKVDGTYILPKDQSFFLVSIYKIKP